MNNQHTKYCVAPGCSNVESPGLSTNITFHNFPDKVSQREEWFEFTGNAYTTVPVNAKVWKNWKICSEHFRPNDFLEEKFIIVEGAKVLSRTLKDNSKPTGTYKTNNDELPSSVVEAVLNLQSDISAMEDVESDPETSYTKCGEIFVSKSGNFLYLCKTCNITLSNIQLFSEHICVSHIFSNTNDTNEILRNEMLSIQTKNDSGISSLTAEAGLPPATDNINKTEQQVTKKSRKKIRFSLGVDGDINKSEEQKTIKEKKSKSEMKKLLKNGGGDNNIQQQQQQTNDDNNQKSEIINTLFTKQQQQTDDDDNNMKNQIINTLFTNTAGLPNTCQFCGKTFKLQSSLMVHTRTHTGERPFDCQFCPSKFRSKSLLVLHIRTHTGEKPYSCAYCCKSFNGKSNLYVHERIHTGAKPYKCNYCDKRFNQKSAQRTHEKKHTLLSHSIINVEQIIHKCSKCNKVFLNAANLGSHNRIHRTKPENGYKLK